MRLMMIAAAMTMAIPALAQEQTVAPKEYHLTLTPQEVEALGAGINELPKRVADPLLMKLREQIMEQQKKAQEPRDANGSPAKGGKK